MMQASELRIGMYIRLDDEIYRIVLAELKVGTAKLPSSVHVRLRNLRTGNDSDRRFNPETRIETIVADTVTMEFSYADGDTLYFMHPSTFDQVGIPQRMVGNYARFLDTGSKLKIEFVGDEVIDAIVPATAEVTVASTGAPMHGDIDAAPKSALLENGMEVKVPQFIKPGDRIKIEVATGRYLERLR